MARKAQNGAEESKKPAPIISKLPIPISDSPLVIDLPDGQKLVVGRMIQGTVIEVATWRGTGRPDSRTSRLMLGMSIGDVNPPKEEPPAPKTVDFEGNEVPAPKKKARSSNKYIAMAQDIWVKVWGEPKPKKAKPSQSAAQVEKINKTGFAGKRSFSAKLPKISAPGISAFKRGKKSSHSFKASEPRIQRASSAESDEIAAWLEEISEKARVKVEGKSVKTTATKPTESAPLTAAKASPAKKAGKKSAIKPAKRK
jgi:hypothetical protein